jgi:threonine aldolase
MLGGGMRQAGVIAAAAHYALEHNVALLAQDHDNAAELARGLALIPVLTVSTPQTNIFWIDMPPAACAPLREALARAQIRVTVGPKMRLVTHLDVSARAVQRTVDVFTTFFTDWRA